MNETVESTVQKPMRAYKIPECILAWLTYLCAFLFCTAFPVGEYPLGGLLLVALLYIGTAILLTVAKIKLRAYPIAVGVSAILLSAVPMLSANSFLSFFAYGYAILTYCYFVYVATGQKSFSAVLLMDYVRALFVLPFRSLRALFSALFMGRGKGSGKVIGRILLGAFLALVPTLIVGLLLSYDSGFSRLIDNIFSIKLGDLFTHLFHLLLAIPMGMAVFSVYASATDGLGEDTVTEESLADTRRRFRILSSVTVLTAVLPLLFVYVVFFVSQWKYYVSGFTGILPEDFSYAEYAREGFFQLCAVSVINFILILIATLFIRRKDDRPPLVLKLVTTVLSVFTLILISTAISKMVLYIDRFGLTQLRVYATWFMLLLAVLFILTATSMYVKRFKPVLVSVLVCLAFFSILALSGPDAQIAEYNVDRYLDGSLEDVDVIAMYDLDDAAVPAMVYLYENMPDTADEMLRNKVTDYLRGQLHEVDKNSGIFTFDLPAYRARKALSRIDLAELKEMTVQ
ncbi:MAG: DUF4173 domain-containing protein [Clostridia bacterium]|nr:DUF4173 domain-containing protein [Clostridia bacterium]